MGSKCVRIAGLEKDLLPLLSDEKMVAATAEFESTCKDVVFNRCICCRRFSLSLQLNKNKVCQHCVKFKDVGYFEKHKLLPIWYLNDEPQYHVPEELTCLTLAEKMLIQLAIPFIPLRHIKKGVFGISGHVCCFDQNVEDFINTLPRSPNDATVLHVLKEVTNEIGDVAARTQCYKVRRSKIACALFWLKKYNDEYKNVKIDMDALNWLNGEEGTLPVLSLSPSSQSDACDDNNQHESQVDFGPTPSLTKQNQNSGDNVTTFGYVDDAPSKVLSPMDVQIHNEVVDEVDRTNKKDEIKVQWPSTGPVPINEYSTTRIFVRAFPWLFPGGLGDIKDEPGDLSDWGQRLLFYEDGRFARDKFFTFFALNYITRHRNAKSGSWFIKGFNRNGPENLEELQQSLKEGKTTFINRLMYFNKCVTGSNSYWYQKRSQVYSWINHHVEAGHGPPNFFITLSCGEYYWPDILRLLRDRMTMAKDDRLNDCYQGSTKFTEIINDYAIVIQEYFQIRFKIWMEKIGKTIFGIKYYWGRFEFAPGRGQIHIHLLAIREDQNIFKLCYEDLKLPDGKKKRDQRLANWANDQFGLTATVNKDFETRQVSPQSSPCSIRLCDLSVTQNGLVEDQQNLLKFCQFHECNGFCLRRKGNKRYVVCTRKSKT